MTDVDRYMLDSKLPVGKPWRAGREVWVYGLFAGRGRGVYKVARLPAGLNPSESDIEILYIEWVETRVTLTEHQVGVILLAHALR